MGMLRFLIPLSGLVLVMGCAPSPSAPDASRLADGKRQCFAAQQVSGFNAIGRDKVYVTVGARTHYELDVLATCMDIDWTNAVAIRTRSGSSWVCEGFDAELIVPGPTGLQRCPVLGVRKLTPAEEEAYRLRKR